MTKDKKSALFFQLGAKAKKLAEKISHQVDKKKFNDKNENGENKKTEKLAKTYEEKKRKFLKLLKKIIDKPDLADGALSTAVSGNKEGISNSIIAKTALKTIKTAITNPSLTASAFRVFDLKAIEELRNIANGEASLDKNNLPLYIKFLADKDIANFLSANSEKLTELVEHLAPKITEILFKALGNIEKIKPQYEEQKKEIQDNSKKFEKLPKYREELELLKQSSSKDNEAINSLSQKINKLESLKKLESDYARAIIVSTLKETALNDPAILNEFLIPGINDILKSLIKDPQKLNELIDLTIDMATQQDAGKKAQLLSNLITKLDIKDLLNSSNLSNILSSQSKNSSKNLGKLLHGLLTNQEILPKNILQVTTEFTPEFFTFLMTKAPKIASKVLDNKDLTGELYDRISYELSHSSGLLDRLIPVIKPEFLAKLAPSVEQLATGILSSTSVDKLDEIYKNLQIMRRSENPVDIETSRKFLISEAVALLQDKNIQGALTKKLPILLADEKSKANITNIVKFAISETVPNIKLPEEFIENTTDFGGKIASAVLGMIPEMTTLSNNLDKHSTLMAKLNNSSNQNQETVVVHENELAQAKVNIVTNISDMLKKITPTFVSPRIMSPKDMSHSPFASYIENNRDSIQNLAMTIAKEGNFYQSLNISEQRLNKLTESTLNLLPKAMDIIIPALSYLTDDRAAAQKLLDQFQILLDAPADFTTKQKMALYSAFADYIIVFLNRTDKKPLKQTIEDQLSGFLQDNSEDLGNILEYAISSTKLGKIFENRGSSLAYIMGSDIQLLAKVTGYYNNRDYYSLFKEVPKLISATITAIFLTGIIVDLVRHVKQSYFTSIATRRAKFEKYANSLSNSGLQKSSNGEKIDLGVGLESLALNIDIRKKSRTFHYSLVHRDFTGLDMSKLAIPLENAKIGQFYFNKAEFGETSFKNSEITNCSFKNAIFKENVSFDGATIDANTLKTLIPSIVRHNKLHEENPIILKNVKIIGDISKINLCGIFDNPDLTKAQTKNTNHKNLEQPTKAQIPPSVAQEAQEIGNSLEHNFKSGKKSNNQVKNVRTEASISHSLK